MLFPLFPALASIMTLGGEGTWIQNLFFHNPLSQWIVTWTLILRMLLSLLGTEVSEFFLLRWFLQGEEPRKANSLENKHNQWSEGSMLKRKHHLECLIYIHLCFGGHGSIIERQCVAFYESQTVSISIPAQPLTLCILRQASRGGLLPHLWNDDSEGTCEGPSVYIYKVLKTVSGT